MIFDGAREANQLMRSQNEEEVVTDVGY